MNAHAIRQKREIMREDCGRASERYAQIAREVFPVKSEFRTAGRTKRVRDSVRLSTTETANLSADILSRE